MADSGRAGRSGFGSTLWRAAIVLVIVCGLLADSNSVEYFTIESNLVVLAYYVVSLAGRRGRSAWTPAPRLRGAVTSYILLTGIVYHFLLQNGNNPIPGLFVADAGASIGNWSQFLLHYVVPIMVLIDWLTVGPRLRVRWRDGLLWAIFPLGYALVMIARGLVLPAVSDRYPYPFFDPTTNGWDGVWSTLTELIIVYLIIVAIVIALDRLLVRVGHRELGTS